MFEFILALVGHAVNAHSSLVALLVLLIATLFLYY